MSILRDCISFCSTLFIESYIEKKISGRELTDDLLINYKKLIENFESIDYNVYADCLIYLYYYANYYKVKNSLSMLKSAKFNKGKLRVLDLGCGSGASTMAIIDFFRSKGLDYEIFVDAVDSSIIQIGLHEAIIDSNKDYKGIYVNRINSDCLDYLDSSPSYYDFVVDGNFICELDFSLRKSVVLKISELLNDSGMLLVVEQEKTGIYEELDNFDFIKVLESKELGPFIVQTPLSLSSFGLMSSRKTEYNIRYSLYGKYHE